MTTTPTPPSDSNATHAEPLPSSMLDDIATIREHWAKAKEHWSPEAMEELHAKLGVLAGRARKSQLPRLADAIFSAEAYLSSFVGSASPMTPEQRETVDTLLAELTPGETTPTPTAPEPAMNQEQIMLLGPLEGPLKTLIEVLLDLHIDIRHVETDLAKHALQDSPPAALIVDVDSIPEIEAVIEELARLNKRTGQHIPLGFVADKDDINTRVKAVRAGGDAFFAPPFDPAAINEKLQNLLNTAPAQSYRVLVVEDDLSQAKFATSILGQAGFQTESVTEPMATLDAIRQFSPDLIVMDIYMPEINGIELTSVVREYNEYASIPIVFLSGEQDTDKQVDALSVGGDDFITKPIRPKQLITVVKNRLRRSQPQHLIRKRPSFHKFLTKNQFIERISAMLSIDPMHVQSTAVLMFAPNHQDHHREQLEDDGYEQLMIELARTAEQPLGEKDALARIDQDRMAILARRKSSNEIYDLAARLHETISAHEFQVRHTDRPVTLGIGLAFSGEVKDDANSLLRRAQIALQHALQKGDSLTVPFDDSFEQQATNTMANNVAPTEEDVPHTIRQCLAKDSFVVLYQPMLDLHERGNEIFDIQLRLPAPNGKLLNLRDIRKDAEKAQLQNAIDRWVLSHALDILKQMRATTNNARVFVSQFSSSALDYDYPKWLAEQLRERHMVGTGLVLDFRLSGLSHDLKAARANSLALHEMDIQVCLSQFPEKPAAFKVLRYVHGDYIRISKRLLKADRDTIKLITSEAHRARAKVIVSQIDNARSIDLHWSSGADFLQGNFIQPPMDNMDYDFSQVVI